MIVADTNLIAYLLIPGDWSELAEEVLREDRDWIAPLLWRSELRNVLVFYMRTQGMVLDQAQATMDKAEHLMNEREYTVNSDAVLELAHDAEISSYDAEFGTLASQMNVKLVTFDRKICERLEQVAISPHEFVEYEG